MASSPYSKVSFRFLFLRHYGLGVDPVNKEGIHINLGSESMIKYYPRD